MEMKDAEMSSLEMKDSEMKTKDDTPQVESLETTQDYEITLMANGGDIRILRSIILCSELVKTVLKGEPDNVLIPLPSVDFLQLQRIVQFLEYHHTNPIPEIQKPLKSTNMVDAVPEWYADFVDNMERDDLLNLVTVANYMNIQPLLDLLCCKIASMIKGKTTEQIRETFDIVNDFTPEEEANVIAENKWAEEN